MEREMPKVLICLAVAAVVLCLLVALTPGAGGVGKIEIVDVALQQFTTGFRVDPTTQAEVLTVRADVIYTDADGDTMVKTVEIPATAAQKTALANMRNAWLTAIRNKVGVTAVNP